MSTGDDKDWKRTIEIGEKNRRTVELIHKWCKHARIEKFGGVGIIEARTGLPIGHHFMACDHAPMGGSIGAWDMEDSAFDFYDKHCVKCNKRSPVGLPNLSTLIDARDQELRRKEQADAAVQLRLKTAAEERKQKRAALKIILPAMPATIIDQLDDMDATHRSGLNQPLLETARMAPDIFTNELIELFFTYLESNEIWFCETGLLILPLLNSDKTRLARQALLLARHEHFVESASKAIVECISEVDTTLINEAFDPLVELARPERMPFSHLSKEGNTEGLLALYGGYPAEIESIIRSKLRGRSPKEIIYAATAIQIIAANHPSIPPLFVREILTKLTRAESLVDFHKAQTRMDDQRFYACLSGALELALVANAKETDSIVVGYLSMANVAAQKRIVHAYIQLLPRTFAKETQQPVEFYTVIIDRLLEVASATIDDDTMLELASAFRDGLSPKLNSIVVAKKNHILGIAILLDDKREKLSIEQEKISSAMEAWEVGNRLDSVISQQKGLIGWVARAAAEDNGTAIAYIEALNGIPEERFYLRGFFVECLSKMGSTPEGLVASVPHLYTAILGSNQLVRAKALRSLEELSSCARNDLPNLMLEAIILALGDPYRIVHKQAASALEKFKLPKKLLQSAKLRLILLMNLYANDKNNREFFIKCAALLIGNYTTNEDERKHLGAYLIKKLSTFDKDFLLKEIDHLYWPLKGIHGLPALLIPLLGEADGEHETEKVAGIIGNFSSEEIFTEKNTLRQAAQKTSSDRNIFGAAIELLTLAGDYEGANLVAKNKLNSTPDTIRTAQLRKYIRALLISTEIEIKASEGSLFDALPSIMDEWANVYTPPPQEE